jgi:RNA methyltransferase, TrmH family
MGRIIVPQCYSSCVPAITSRQNPIVTRFRAAAKGDRADEILLDGAHLIAEAMAAGIRIREVAVLGSPGDIDSRGSRDIADIVDRLRRLAVPVTTASAAVMDALSPVQSASPIVAIADRPIDVGSRASPAFRVYGATPFVLIAFDVQDPGNVGAIVRVAEAGGSSGVVCAGACADPFGWKALRGSMGSALRLPVLVYRDSREAVDEARRHGCRIVATAPRGGQPLFDADLRGSIAVLIGGEGPGLPAPWIDEADERVTIPMQPPVESLNTAVSAALIVYEARRQRTKEK